jgi:hypothetical protein
MSELVWKLPVPATALYRSPELVELPKRQCELTFDVEGDDGGWIRWRLLFGGVEAYKCTYLTSISAEIFNTAYGKVVKLGQTPWLDEIMKVYLKSGPELRALHHLMIVFDDGPCYEFICTMFEPLSTRSPGSP